MSIVSRLGVVLGLDSAEFNKGLGLAESKLGSFGASSLASKLSLAAVGAAFVSTAVSAFQFADKINDIAQSTEMTAGKVLAFSQALALNGVHSEAATKMISSFSVKVEEAASGSDKGRANFAKMGITLKDIATLDSASLMEKTLKGLSAIEDPITRNALAFQLLGKAAKGLDLNGAYDEFMRQKDKNKDVDKAFSDTGDAIDNIDKLSIRMKTNFATNMGGAFKEVTIWATELFDWLEKVKISLLSINDLGKNTGIEKYINHANDKNNFFALGANTGIDGTKYQGANYGQNTSVGAKMGTPNKANTNRTIELGEKAKALAEEEKKKAIKQSEELEKQVKSYEQQTVAAGRTLTEVEKLTLEFEKTGKFDTIKEGANKQRLIDAAKELDLAHDLVKSRETELKYANEKRTIINATNDVGIATERLTLEASLANETDAIKTAKLEQFDITQNILKMERDMSVAVLNTAQGQTIVTNAEQAQADAMKARATLVAATKAKSLQDEIDAVNVSAERFRLEMGMAGASDTQVKKALELFDLKQKMLDMAKNGNTEAQIIAYHDARIAAIDAEEANTRAQNTFQAGWETSYNNFTEKAKDSAALGAEAFNSMAGSMNSALDNFVQTGKLSFSDLAGSIIKDLISIELKAEAMSIFSSFGGFSGIMGSAPIGSAGSGSGLMGLFSSMKSGLGFADGGSPPLNQASMVGERGAELFVPRTAGTIIPNHALSALGGGNQPQTVYNGTVIQNMSAIDTQSGLQFLAKNKTAIFAANQSAQRSLPQSR